MWWLRTLIVCGVIGLLAACGFRPMYGKEERIAVADDLAMVWIESIDDRVGQMVHNHLLTSFNPRGAKVAPRYRLKIMLSETTDTFAKRSDETATRANLRLTGGYRLIDTTSGKIVTNGSTLAVVSYNLVDADYAVIVSRDNARTRAAHDVAEDITTAISTYFLRRAEAAKGGS